MKEESYWELDAIDKEYGWTARERNKAVIIKAKDRPCEDCDQRYPPHIMDFDHVPGRGRKLFQISRNAGQTLEVLRVEMAKCDVVCANCHRDRTWRRKRIGMVHSIAEDLNITSTVTG